MKQKYFNIILAILLIANIALSVIYPQWVDNSQWTIPILISVGVLIYILQLNKAIDVGWAFLPTAACMFLMLYNWPKRDIEFFLRSFTDFISSIQYASLFVYFIGIYAANRNRW